MNTKLSKANLYAIVESALFAVGALLLAWVVIDVNAPLWVLFAGLIIAGAGATIWFWPFLENILFPGKGNLRQSSINEDGADAMSYELHRPVAEPEDPDLPDLDF